MGAECHMEEANGPSGLWGSLPVVLGLLLWHPAGASGPCWESSKCQDLTSEAGILGPARWAGGGGLEREEGKRSYSMEHFRWGKPVGRKRRPIKVYPNGVEEESAESYPLEFRRELALSGTGAPPEEEEEEEDQEEEEEKKAGSSYRMRHFRWHAPLKDKRYGGFMTSEHSQTPLVTLFKNAIIKSAYKKGQ
ncbi:pro-opiomelanocortin [Egretta garzetta]|uniref:pro-opiomelanocortin n=1 Tax=Egretta garzetta TaxID=188379 RepID=UPI00051EE1A0|nr:pro-opiomelanocortin [Egretta garzetta]